MVEACCRPAQGANMFEQGCRFDAIGRGEACPVASHPFSQGIAAITSGIRVLVRGAWSRSSDVGQDFRLQW